MSESAKKRLAPFVPIDAASVEFWYNHPELRWFWSIPFALGLCCVFAALLLRGTAENPVANEAASRAVLMSLAPTPVPKEEDAWEDYKLAAQAWVAFSGSPANGFVTDPMSYTDSESKHFEPAVAQSFWKANAQTIALIQNGAKQPRCSFGLDYSQLPWSFPSLSLVDQNVRLLGVDARCRARLGDHAGAAKSIHAMLCLAQQIEQQPFQYCSYTAQFCESTAYNAVQAILICDTPTTSADLAAYRQALVPPANPYPRMTRSFGLDRAYLLWLWDSIQAQTLSTAAKNKLDRTLVSSSPLLYGNDRRCYVAVMHELLAMFARNELPKDKGALIERFRTGPVPVTRYILPRFNECISAVNAYEKAVLMDVTLAFLQYRAKHNRDAKTLDELVPEFLKAVPDGVTTGQPVRIQRGLIGAETTVFYGLQEFCKDKPWLRICATGYNGRDDGGPFDYRGIGDGPDDNIILVSPLPEVPPQK